MSYISTSWGISALAAAVFCGAGGFKYKKYPDGRIEWDWESTLYALDKLKPVFGNCFVELPINDKISSETKDQFERESLYIDRAIPNRYLGDHMDNIVRLVQKKLLLDPLIILELVDNVLQHHNHNNFKLKKICENVEDLIKAYMNGKIQLNQIGVIVHGPGGTGLCLLSLAESRRLNIHPDKY
jgi:hypothetical protein